MIGDEACNRYPALQPGFVDGVPQAISLSSVADNHQLAPFLAKSHGKRDEMRPSLFFRDPAHKAHRSRPKAMSFPKRRYRLNWRRRELCGIDHIGNDLDEPGVLGEHTGGSLGQGHHREGPADGPPFQPPGQLVLKHIQPGVRGVDRETGAVHRQDQGAPQ